MQALFIRHGSAEPAGAWPDADRALTEQGRQEVRRTARALTAMGVKLERVLCSPLTRAVETAGIVAEVHGGAEVDPAEFLAPPTDAKALRKRLAELAGQGLSAVGLVGHTPSLEACVAALVGRSGAIGLSLSKAGAACVEFDPDEPGGGSELRWLMRREQLAMLSGRE